MLGLLGSLVDGGGSSLAVGSIISFNIKNVGEGYVGGSYTNVPLINSIGNGSNALCDIDVGQGGITKTEIKNYGNGGTAAAIYTNLDVVSITGTGSGAKATIETQYRGKITSLYITQDGFGGTDGTYYNISPVNTVSPPAGKGLKVNLTIVGGALNAIEIIDGGSGYLDSGVFTFNPLEVDGLIGASVAINGLETYAVKDVAINTAGQSYDTLDELTVDPAAIGGVTGFMFNPTGIIPAGTIYRVKLVENGENYSSRDFLSVDNANLGGTGSGLVLTPTLCYNEWNYAEN